MSAEFRDGFIYVDSDALADALVAADAAIRRQGGNEESDPAPVEHRPASALKVAGR